MGWNHQLDKRSVWGHCYLFVSPYMSLWMFAFTKASRYLYMLWPVSKHFNDALIWRWHTIHMISTKTRDTPLKTNISPWKLMVGRWYFLLKWFLFWGHVNFQGVYEVLQQKTKVLQKSSCFFSKNRRFSRKFQVKFRDMLTLEPEDCCEAWFEWRCHCETRDL